MLKRYQVLMSDWMEEYIKLVADKYGLSSSSVIRVHLSLGILSVISSLHQEYKPDFEYEELLDISTDSGHNDPDKERVHKMMSKILFEARKAVEYRNNKQRSPKTT